MFSLSVFGIFDLVLLILVLGCMSFGIFLDRRGQWGTKWWMLFICTLVLGALYYSHWSVAGIWAAVTSWEFWKPACYFLIIGVVYSQLEFVINIGRTRRWISGAWQNWLATEVAVKQAGNTGMPELVAWKKLLAEAHERGGAFAHFQIVANGIREFVQSPGRFASIGKPTGDVIVRLKVADDKLSIDPSIDRAVMSQCLFAWTVLWPLYAINLLFGDLLVELFSGWARLLARMFDGFVKAAFNDVFKT